MTPTNCGCAIELRDKKVPLLNSLNLDISYCPTHAAAFRYKEALEKISSDNIHMDPNDIYSTKCEPFEPCDCASLLAKSALAPEGK